MFELFFKYPRATYARSELIYAGTWPDWILYALAVAAAAAIVWMLLRRRSAATGLQLAVIAVLQFCMLAAVVWVLKLPTLRAEKLTAGQNAVAFVLDVSESMNYGVGESRLDTARNALRPFVVDDGNADYTVHRFELAQEAIAVNSFQLSAASGVQTSFYDGLLNILRQSKSDSLAAVVLSSDGGDTSGGLSVEQLGEIASFGVPVHTIPVGREAMPEDLELSDVVLAEKALPGSALSARLTVRHDEASTARIKVYDGDALLASRTIELRGDTNTTATWLELSLAEAGPHRLDFTLEGKEGEQEFRNNGRSRLIDIVDDDYRILYFEGEPRWEYKFMRRAVHNDEDLHIASLLRVSPNKYYRQGIDSPEQLEDGFPQTKDELFSYDALIIGSVEAASLRPAQQQLIRDFVSERGGSLLMLAGPNGLGNGGWGQTVVGDALPTRLPASTSDTFRRDRVPARLTIEGSEQQMLRLASDADANRLAWLELPDVADYQLVGALKPAAMALLSVETGSGSLPLLISQPFGRGFSYVLATGGTWRWQMSMPVEDQKHETFWRQLLRTMVSSAPGNVSLSADGEADSALVTLRAEFRAKDFQPMENIGVTAVVSHEDGATMNVDLAPAPNERGVYRADFEPDASGMWYVETVAERDGQPVSTARASLHHESGQAEHFNIRSNPTLLGKISEATGGHSLSAARLDALPDLLRYSSTGITEQEYRPIWNALAVFLVLVVLKSVEWLLRRRWNTI